MKKVYLAILTLSFFSITNSSFAQTYTYLFNNNFNELGGAGPALTESLSANGSCLGSNGSFGTQTITTTLGTCGSTAQPIFTFSAGDGLQFDNSTSFIGSTYTINIFFEFTTIAGGYQRIIDFSNGADDNGIYSFVDCLSFPPYGSGSGTCPSFVTGNFYLVSLVRDGGTKQLDVYINGALFTSYNDAGDDAVPTTATTPVNFFLDSDCENLAGSVKLISLSPSTSTSTDISNTWNGLCATVLPLHLTNFAASKQNNTVFLTWSTVNETNTSHFELERSGSGNNFIKIADVATSNVPGTRNYNYTDRQPLSTNFYRLKMVDIDGKFTYSGIVKVNITGNEKFEVYPNPANEVITVSGIKDNAVLTILSTDGKRLLQKQAEGQSLTIDISKYPPGLYILQYFDGEKIQSQKVVKQ